MKVVIASIFTLLAVANAAILPEDSQESEIKLPSHDPHSGLLMVGYVMKVVALPTATMAKLVDVAFPEIEAGAKDAVNELDNCLKEVYSSNVTVCAKFDAITKECMLPVKKYYEANLPENSKDIPKMIADSYAAVVQKVCESKTEDFLELSNQCLFNPGSQEQRDEVKKTYEEKVKIFKAAPTRANLCGVINGVRPLIEVPIKASCQSDVTVKAYMALYDASARPCNE